MSAERHERVIVFSRAPRPGTVKTRLIPLLGPKRAARLQKTLLERTMAAAAALPAVDLELHSTDVTDDDVRACAARHRARVVQQEGADLGERMHTALIQALERDRCSAVVLVGSDCPLLSTQYLAVAFAALREGNDAVFGPAEDGGYVLVGVTRPIPEIFSSIAWSTPAVMDQTRRRAGELGCRWRELETLWDIDGPADYERFVRERQDT
jgi:uncharacterized protein